MSNAPLRSITGPSGQGPTNSPPTVCGGRGFYWQGGDSGKRERVRNGYGVALSWALDDGLLSSPPPPLTLET